MHRSERKELQRRRGLRPVHHHGLRNRLCGPIGRREHIYKSLCWPCWFSRGCSRSGGGLLPPLYLLGAKRHHHGLWKEKQQKFSQTRPERREPPTTHFFFLLAVS